MNSQSTEKLIAYLTLFSGLSISAVAVYYSVIGLTAIFSAAVIPIIIMGVTLELSKLVATLWLKQNWNIAPKSIKVYLISAIALLMLVTSMGIFGFLSKAHSDQNLVSGDVLAKIAVYDEKIKTSKENIDANRKALKQLDEAVDQVMARSTTETGAERAVQIRRQQSKERTRLLQEIEAEQKKISAFNEARAPIAAEVRKVEAEVGPLKYIAAFFYGDTDQAVLEKSVTWVIIILIAVFDPLAIVLLLAAQSSFQKLHNQLQTVIETTEGNSPEKESDVVSTATVTENQDTETIIMESRFDEYDSEESNTKFPDIESDFDLSKHPYLFNKPRSYHPPGVEPVGPVVYKSEVPVVEPKQTLEGEPAQYVEPQPKPVMENGSYRFVRTKVFPRVNSDVLYVQNEEQQESSLWTATSTTISDSEYVKISREKMEQQNNKA